IGLETAHPDILPRLNKHMTLDQFSEAAYWLHHNNIALRAFVLLKPPFLEEAEALYWAQRSLDFAFDCGATAVVLIPTRTGNDALEALSLSSEFSQPRLKTLEEALLYGINRRRGRVFADLWDLKRFAVCDSCFSDRMTRLEKMNLDQELVSPVLCQD